MDRREFYIYLHIIQYINNTTHVIGNLYFFGLSEIMFKKITIMNKEVFIFIKILYNN